MNAFVSLKTQHRLKSITHQIDTASEDCAARAMNDPEGQGEDIDKPDKEKNDTVEDKKCESEAIGSKNRQKESKSESDGVSSYKEHLKEGDQPKKSDYELQRERNIAQNKALLASIKVPGFQVAMEEIGKGAPAKKKNKAEKPKPNPEERRTSARLSSANGKWVFRVLNSKRLPSNGICQI